MSKYIRLKNKIVKIDAEDSECYYFNKLKKFVYKDEGYKIADTIEELCDNFMVEYANGEHMLFPAFYHLKRHHDLYNQDYHHVAGRYGCIWVAGKGLIYVAKMNDKGELELI